MTGMSILKIERHEKAEEIRESESLVMGGYVAYKLVGLQVAKLYNI